jgi:murein DD-endopeptidase MepM/ murein hydrolase activator NlpD
MMLNTASPLPVIGLAVAWVMLGVMASRGITTLAEASDSEAALAERRLLIPVVGVSPDQLRDSFNERRGDALHEAIDIHAPKGTPVVATDDGRVTKLFKSVPGGLTIYQADNANDIVYYYAHLDRYAEGVREGQAVNRGDVIGYVGTTGNAARDAPHLHFAIFKLPPGKEWWKGTAINPYPFLISSSAKP